MPKEDREELATARSRLDQATILWGWGILFLVFLQWSFWALPSGFLVALLAWRLMRYRAKAYGDLLRAAFDLRRFALYDTLRLARPVDPENEVEKGALLTRFLFRGETEGLSAFVDPPKSS